MHLFFLSFKYKRGKKYLIGSFCSNTFCLREFWLREPRFMKSVHFFFHSLCIWPQKPQKLQIQFEWRAFGLAWIHEKYANTHIFLPFSHSLARYVHGYNPEQKNTKHETKTSIFFTLTKCTTCNNLFIFWFIRFRGDKFYAFNYLSSFVCTSQDSPTHKRALHDRVLCALHSMPLHLSLALSLKFFAFTLCNGYIN